MTAPDEIMTTPATRVYALPLDGEPRGAARRRAESDAVRRLVACVFGPGAVYTHLPSGAPAVEGLPRKAYVSVSHGAGVALLAVSEAGAVGVDVESGRDQLERVAPKFLSPGQQSVYGSSPLHLLMAWTAKEALYKAMLRPGFPLAGIPLPPVPGPGEVEVDSTRFRISFSGTGARMVALAEKI